MQPLRSANKSGEIDGGPAFISQDALIRRRALAHLDRSHEALEADSRRETLYRRFKDNETLVLAVLDLVEETWDREVAPLIDRESDPVAALIALARGHAAFCRQDLAQVMMALRLDFTGENHPVGRKLERISETLVQRCARLITVGRRTGRVPAGPPARAAGLALIGATEGAVIELAGRAPYDETFAARAAAGVLGLDYDAIR